MSSTHQVSRHLHPHPVNPFHSEIIARILTIANQLHHKTTITAMDALRNLIIQAFLIERTDLAHQLIKQGFIQTLEQVIEKGITQI